MEIRRGREKEKEKEIKINQRGRGGERVCVLSHHIDSSIFIPNLTSPGVNTVCLTGATVALAGRRIPPGITPPPPPPFLLFSILATIGCFGQSCMHPGNASSIL